MGKLVALALALMALVGTACSHVVHTPADAGAESSSGPNEPSGSIETPPSGVTIVCSGSGGGDSCSCYSVSVPGSVGKAPEKCSEFSNPGSICCASAGWPSSGQCACRQPLCCKPSDGECTCRLSSVDTCFNDQRVAISDCNSADLCAGDTNVAACSQ